MNYFWIILNLEYVLRYFNFINIVYQNMILLLKMEFIPYNI